MMMPHLALLLHTGAQIGLTSFSVHSSTVIGIGLLGALYVWRARQEARRPAAPPGFPPNASQSPLGRVRPALFAAGLITMFLSLNGWLHDISDYYLFSAHMVQHLLLTFVVPPLLIMGTPAWMLRPALTVRPVRAIARRITSPLFCYVSFNLVIIAWHMPVLYNQAMAHHNVHILQHLLFMVTAVLMWWPVLSPLPELPRLSYPMQMLYLFLLTIPMAIVAIFITYSQHILYPAYASAPRLWGISPLTDQLIGGLIMWIPGGLFIFTVISVIFYKWQLADGVETQAGAQLAA